MGNRETGSGGPEDSNVGNRSDADADDVTQLFRNPKSDPRLRAGSVELPEVPQATFKRPEEPKPGGGGNRPGAMVNIETPGDTRKTAIASSVGVMLVASLLVGAGIGWLIDKFILRDPPTPWGMVCGLLLGVVIGFYNVARIAAKLQDDERKP